MLQFLENNVFALFVCLLLLDRLALFLSFFSYVTLSLQLRVVEALLLQMFVEIKQLLLALLSKDLRLVFFGSFVTVPIIIGCEHQTGRQPCYI